MALTQHPSGDPLRQVENDAHYSNSTLFTGIVQARIFPDMAMQLNIVGSNLGVATRARQDGTRARPITASPAVPAVTLPVTARRTFSPLPNRSQARQQLSAKHVVAATSEANFDEGIAGTNDYSPLLAVAAFAAVHLNKLHVDRVKLLQALAILQLFVTAVNLVSRRGVGDKVSAFVGPAVLAAAVLNIRHVTYLDTATALFGYFLSENLEGITGIPFYAFVATLAVALYLGYGTLWYVIAFGLAAAGKVYNSTKNSNPLPLVVLPALAATVFAVWKEATFPLALSIYLAQTVWSGFGAVDAVSKRIQE